MLFEILGWLSAAILPFVAAPQLLKIVKSKQVQHVSLATYAMLLVGQSAQLAYVTDLHAWPVVIGCGVGLLLNGTVFALMLAWRNRDDAD